MAPGSLPSQPSGSAEDIGSRKGSDHARRGRALDHPEMGLEVMLTVRTSDETMIVLLNRARMHNAPCGGSLDFPVPRHRWADVHC